MNEWDLVNAAKSGRGFWFGKGGRLALPNLPSSYIVPEGIQLLPSVEATTVCQSCLL
jgi:hypothetical protein